MKLITAIIREVQLDRVREALIAAGCRNYEDHCESRIRSWTAKN